MGGDDNVIGRFLKKILYIGAFAFILNSFLDACRHHLSLVSAGWASPRVAAAMSAAISSSLDGLAGTGFSAAWPLLQQVSELTGFTTFFDNFLTIAVLLFAWAIVIITFFILAVQCSSRSSSSS